MRINASKGVRFAAGSPFKDALNSNRPIKQIGAGKKATSKRAPANKTPVAKKAPVRKKTTTTAKAAGKR